ncbi:MAG: hypothetical protein DID92_2727744752, partial [Candidatus Nitrotoga sp. SPKER]
MKNLTLAVVMIAGFTSSFTHAEDNNPNTPLTFNGYAETYYSYDFNKPINHTKPPFI